MPVYFARANINNSFFFAFVQRLWKQRATQYSTASHVSAADSDGSVGGVPQPPDPQPAAGAADARPPQPVAATGTVSYRY